MHSHTTPPSSPTPLNRRRFLASTGTAALTVPALAPQVLTAAAQPERVRIGLIGCGGRGRWIAKLFQKHGGYEFVGVHDYFTDRAQAAGDELGVPADARFTGLKGYERLIDLELDAVAIESPPYFHPEQAAAAVAAGKHVYMAKPLAVDVPGCLTIEQLGQRASAEKLVFYIDFQTRAMPDYRTALNHVHQGMIGPVSLVEATYHCGNTFDRHNADLKKDPHNPEARMRAWGLDSTLSGDVITEQNIHALDVAAWVLDTDPIKAYGTCHHHRGFAGTCHDTWAVVFYYPKNVICSFNAKQFGYGYDDILCRAYGPNGTLETHYGGKVSVKARDDGFNGSSPNIYQQGAVNNIASFHQAILTGNHTNTTVPASVRSNLTTILGRTAAYQQTEVAWADMMRKSETLQYDLSGLKG